ncbi:hypothetical protein ACX16Z_29085, partial [Bacillus cereus]
SAIVAGQLSASVHYNTKQYKQEDMELLASIWEASLNEIILHCTQKEHSELTPSDLSSKGLDFDELDNILSELFE